MFKAVYEKRSSSFDVPKLERYFVLLYFGPESEKMKCEIVSLLSKFYPFLNPRIVLINPFSLRAFSVIKTDFLNVANRLWFMNFVAPRVLHHTSGQLYVTSTVESSNI